MVNKARPNIRQIHFKQTMATPDESRVKKNTDDFKNFYTDLVFEEMFARYFGFSAETDALDLWPQKLNCLDIVIKKIGRKWPRLVWKIVNIDGQEVQEPMPIQYSLLRRFGDERTKIRQLLNLPPKLKGTLLFYYHDSS